MQKKSTSRASTKVTLRPATSRAFQRQLGDSAVMEEYFRQHLHQFFPEARRLLGVTCTHRPTLSTSSYLTEFALRLSNRSRTSVQYVRGNAVDLSTYNIFRQLDRHHQHIVRLPRPLAYFSRPGYIFYEEVGGHTLRKKSFRSPRWPQTMLKVGAALATFQQTSPRGLRKLTWSNEQRWLRIAAATIARLSPKHTALAKTVRLELMAAEAVAWKHAHGLVHKDFQASNIITGPRLGLIDFTLSGAGPLAFDVGTFLAHLSVMTHGQVRPVVAANWRRAFLKGYQHQIGFRLWRTIGRDLAIFELRSLLDILAITLTTLGERRDPGRMYVRWIVERISTLRLSL